MQGQRQVDGGVLVVALQYKGRIYKGKLSVRGVRYIAWDQTAELFPFLRRRWLLPNGSLPIAEAARQIVLLPSAVIDEPVPACFERLGIAPPRPVQQTHRVYAVGSVTLTGWAGAMMRDGLLLTVGSQHNWAGTLRAHPHRLRSLPGQRAYFNLMTPNPAKGHIFHWVFDYILPLIAFLESGQSPAGLGLIVNADPSGVQSRTLGFLKSRYGITEIETVAKREAVKVPDCYACFPDQTLPRALQPPAALGALADLATFLARDASVSGTTKRIYVSRNDARLRRVRNEDRVLALLVTRGFNCVTLKGMPIADQVELFRQAEVVVAPHGAGLAHIAWCKPGTKIIEFFPDPAGPRGKSKNATANFWLIAKQRNLDYAVYFAGPVENRTDAFAIPEDLLAAALDAASIK
jgi:Glycosyltransferase 61